MTDHAKALRVQVEAGNICHAARTGIAHWLVTQDALRLVETLAGQMEQLAGIVARLTDTAPGDYAARLEQLKESSKEEPC